MNLRKIGNRLRLNNDDAFDEQVETLPPEHGIAITHGDLDLPLRSEAVKLQFVRERILVDFLEEAGPEATVHLDGTTDHPMSDRFDLWRE